MTGLLVIAAGLGVLWFVPHGRAPVLPALSAAGLAVYAFGAVSGLVAGFLAGLLGIGGSLVVMPALYLLLPAFGVQPVDVPHAAVATALAAMLPTALCGTWRKHRQGTLDHRSLMRLAPGTLLGAAAGALFALQLHGPVLALAFVAQSAYYGWGQLRAAPAAPTSLRARIARRSAGLPASWCMAPLAGAFCACLGMGGGSLVVPYLAARGVALLPATAVSQGVNLCIAGRRDRLCGAARRARRARSHRVLARRAVDRCHGDAGGAVRCDGGTPHPAALVPTRARCRQRARRRRAAAAHAVAVTGRGHGSVSGRCPRPRRSGTPAPDPNW
jgi:uncharacterized membrane protein YfcA